MLTASITATGHTTSELADALREALKKVEEGFTSGGDSNNTSSYRLDVDGAEIVKYGVLRDFGKLDEERYDRLEEVEHLFRGKDDFIVGFDEHGQVVWKRSH